MMITNIKQDKLRILRWLRNEFYRVLNSIKIRSSNVTQKKVYNSIVKLHDQYFEHFRNVLNSINSDKDKRIKRLNLRLDKFEWLELNTLRDINLDSSIYNIQICRRDYFQSLKKEYSKVLRIDVVKKDHL